MKKDLFNLIPMCGFLFYTSLETNGQASGRSATGRAEMKRADLPMEESTYPATSELDARNARAPKRLSFESRSSKGNLQHELLILLVSLGLVAILTPCLEQT